LKKCEIVYGGLMFDKSHAVYIKLKGIFIWHGFPSDFHSTFTLNVNFNNIQAV